LHFIFLYRLSGNNSNMRKIVLIYIILTLLAGCAQTNEKKQDFIYKNIKKINETQAKRYGELIVPELISKDDIEF